MHLITGTLYFQQLQFVLVTNPYDLTLNMTLQSIQADFAMLKIHSSGTFDMAFIIIVSN